MTYEEFVKENIEKIHGSDTFLAFVSGDFLKDGECALQIGAALLMEKPIYLVVIEGCKIPKKLLLVADKIEYIRGPDDIGLAVNKLVGKSGGRK